MKVSIAAPKTTEKHLDVEVPQDVVTQAYEGKVTQAMKKVQINGFRPGKVPRNIVVQRFGAAIRQDAIQEIVDNVIREELQKNEINPVSQPTVIELDDNKESGLKFKAVVEIDPDFELAEGYGSLGIVPADVTVTEEEISAELTEWRKRLATWTVVDRESKDGDVVKGEYLYLAIEDESRDLPEKPVFRVEIGNTGTPDFDKQLLGLKAGDEKEVKFVFPASYQAEELRGRLATYKLRVDEIQEAVLDALDEDFAKKLGAEDVADLNAKITERLTDAKKTAALNEAQEKAMDILLEKNVFDVPESRLVGYVARALQKERITQAELEQNREEALKAVRRFRILDAIAGKENIKPSQEEVDARIQEMSEYYGVDFEKLKQDLRQSGRVVGLREELRLDKTLKFIVGQN